MNKLSEEEIIEEVEKELKLAKNIDDVAVMIRNEYIQGLLDLYQKEKEKNDCLAKDNLDLDRLYRRTASHLHERGKDELADYMLAQIGAVPTWTDFEDYSNWISKEIYDNLLDKYNKLVCCHLQYEEMTGVDLLLPDKVDVISIDKIKVASGIEEDATAEQILAYIATIVSENNRLEDIEDKKVQIEYQNVFNKGVKSVEDKIKTKIGELEDALDLVKTANDKVAKVQAEILERIIKSLQKLL